MNLKAHYDKLYTDAIAKIECDAYQVDKLIDSTHDRRFGITLLIRPPEEVKYEIQQFLTALKEIDPSQYYYPTSDIHITVMSIISCYEGFSLGRITTSDYTAIVASSLSKISKFRIRFQGITAADTGIMVQGFPENDTLNLLRDKLRTDFKNANLEQSIDKRYTIQTAHATVVRFREQISRKDKFLNLVQQFRQHDFGMFEVCELELVYNDWYQREHNTIVLERFRLDQSKGAEI